MLCVFTDIDECEEDVGICQHNCTNTVGSFICSCPPGYKLARNKRKCIDINECQEGTVDCGPDRMCFNTRGDYSCIDIPCPTDYKRDPLTNYCVLECIDTALPCPANATYADVIEFRTLALPSGILAYQDLIRLTAYNQDNVKLEKTVFSIIKNDPKNEFELRLEDGSGILFMLSPLEDKQVYQITVRARSYDSEREHLQYQTTFIIHISVSAYPY
ncbi:hypothetical protein KUTeg_021544 [Tegillarca granosa]|uniref:EGF-like domain-containing protein n=1 Tax=Tegillarca granosa TaxID=220873 RepID=A0ABQ9E945_TEGGR|nr:hypothetical protein KUTeg_021544 [Tegillarca granosa]